MGGIDNNQAIAGNNTESNLSPLALRLTGISKAYGKVQANSGIDLDIRKNEVHAIVGENGAGKSTLMKIIYGIEEPDSGSIEIWGKPRRIRTPMDAIRLGVGMVFQHFTLAPHLTVAENIVLGSEPHRLGWLREKNITKLVENLLSSFGLKVSPHALAMNLSVSQQQRIEILKTIYRRAKLIIFDEPTAVLTPQQIESLFDIIRKLSSGGHTIIFISHKLMEVKAIADRITVLRQGKKIATVDADSVTPGDIANLMVGRSVISKRDRVAAQPKQSVCRIKNLTVLSDANTEAVKDLSLNLYGGEILGLAGVEGNGQSQLIESLSGLRPVQSGQICLNGVDITNYSVIQRRKAGMAFIPPDRRVAGAAEQAKISEVILADRMSDYPYKGRMFLKQAQIYKKAGELVEEYSIKTDGVDTIVENLSGGNVQKVVLAREISCSPKLLIAAEPTRGIDIAAADFAHGQLMETVGKGLAVLLLTSDLDELIELSHRIAVIYKGQIVAIEVNRKDLDVKLIGRYMMGVERQDERLLSMQLEQ